MGLRAGVLLKVGFGTGFGVGETTGLGIGRGVYLGFTGVRLPVITSAPFSTVKSMQVFVQLAAIEKTFDDEFKGWSIGDLQVIDSIDSLFDGKRVSFPIRINGEQTTIRSRRGSNVEVKSNLLIFINNILQVLEKSEFVAKGKEIYSSK